MTSWPSDRRGVTYVAAPPLVASDKATTLGIEPTAGADATRR